MTTSSTSTVTTTETTTTDGLLISTSGDLNANVGGSAVYSFGDGYTTETLKGNSTHTVDAGKYTLSTSDDIDMTADGNIELSAYDMNIELSGSKTITVNGEKVEIVKSPAKTNRMSTSQEIMWGDTTLIKFSASFSMSMSISLSLSGAATNSISLGLNVSVQLGAAVKAVSPYNLTLVSGMDYKYVRGDTIQYATTYQKTLTGFDYKKAKYDFKIADFEYKTKSLDISKSAMEIKDTTTDEVKGQITAKKAQIQADNLTSHSILSDLLSYM